MTLDDMMEQVFDGIGDLFFNLQGIVREGAKQLESTGNTEQRKTLCESTPKPPTIGYIRQEVGENIDEAMYKISFSWEEYCLHRLAAFQVVMGVPPRIKGAIQVVTNMPDGVIMTALTNLSLLPEETLKDLSKDLTALVTITVWDETTSEPTLLFTDDSDTVAYIQEALNQREEASEFSKLPDDAKDKIDPKSFMVNSTSGQVH